MLTVDGAQTGAGSVITTSGDPPTSIIWKLAEETEVQPSEFVTVKL
jgi:hypothetical protein